MCAVFKFRHISMLCYMDGHRQLILLIDDICMDVYILQKKIS